MPPQTTRLLFDHFAEFVGDRPDALVFTSTKGSPLLNRYYAPVWQRAKRDADIPLTSGFTTCDISPAPPQQAPVPRFAR